MKTAKAHTHTKQAGPGERDDDGDEAEEFLGQKKRVREKEKKRERERFSPLLFFLSFCLYMDGRTHSVSRSCPSLVEKQKKKI